MSITPEGKITAMADYRIDGEDIGNGRVDIVMRRSQEGNTTVWSDETKVAKGTQIPGSYDYAFGDPAVVVNSVSTPTEEVLVMAVGGNTHFLAANAESKNKIARIYSSDGGENWHAEDLTSQFFGTEESIFKNQAYAAFFASGRMLQSNFRASGKSYNRIYAGLLVKGEDNLQVIEMHLEDCQMQATSNADTIVFNHSPEYPDEELTQRAGNPTSQSIWDQD